VLALISDGEPNCPPDEASRECFPEALRFRVTPDSLVTKEPSEPIAADVRKGRDGRKNAQLKLIAGILGIGFDLLKRREQERRMRQLTIAGAVLLMLAVAFAGVAYVAFMARNEASADSPPPPISPTVESIDASDRLLFTLTSWAPSAPGTMRVIS
jgi:hypothetical protein